MIKGTICIMVRAQFQILAGVYPVFFSYAYNVAEL